MYAQLVRTKSKRHKVPQKCMPEKECELIIAKIQINCTIEQMKYKETSRCATKLGKCYNDLLGSNNS